MVCDPDPGAVFDADEFRERNAALLDIRILDQHGCFPVAAIGHHRIVGIQFTAYAVLLEDAFHAQHFLNLVAHGQFVLEHQRNMTAQLHGAVLLVREHLLAEGFACLAEIVSLSGPET